MPRPQRYDTDVLLDAAARILAAEGPAAVTMSAVARAAGAPSGSMYHRFATRAVLCAQLWLRTQERFHRGLLAALSRSSDPQDSCVAAARFTVHWCRADPVQAQVLLVGANELSRSDWPADAAQRHDEMRRELEHALHRMYRPGDGERVLAAVVDVPYGVVRRHLRSGTRIPAEAEEIAEECARALVRHG